MYYVWCINDFFVLKRHIYSKKSSVQYRNRYCIVDRYCRDFNQKEYMNYFFQNIINQINQKVKKIVQKISFFWY